MQSFKRRLFLKTLSATGVLSLLSSSLLGCASSQISIGRVVVVGGGFAGATTAKYVKKLNPTIDVTLIEPNNIYYTCAFSNAVIAGLQSITQIAHSYNKLREIYGVNVVVDSVKDIHPDNKSIMLSSGDKIKYDRLVVAPGILLKWDSPEGYDENASKIMPHAWKAGKQTSLLQQQLQSMKDGGTVAISVPAAPFRCPPGPYERASLIAEYLKGHKPRSKILILDSNGKFPKQALFMQAWQELYPNMIEWVSVTDDGAVQRVDVASRTLITLLEEHKVDVANVIPAQTAARIAIDTGLADATSWCPVNQKTFESKHIADIHVLGDACMAGEMPKSASSANSQAKNCALALVASLTGETVPEPSFHNTCYSLVGRNYGISITMIYRLKDGSISAVNGAGGVSPLSSSPDFRVAEANFARGWYSSITSDTFG